MKVEQLHKALGDLLADTPDAKDFDVRIATEDGDIENAISAVVWNKSLYIQDYLIEYGEQRVLYRGV